MNTTGNWQMEPTLADGERVELHLHTKYSAMDGLCDVAEAVEMAAEMGHAALAITDHAVVRAFPEAAQVCQKIQSTHPGFKIIYGCEVVFVPATRGLFAVGEENESLPPFHMMLLAQNQQGLKNLYKIISESHTTYYEKEGSGKGSARPRVPQALLEKYRDGLLVGSGAEKGGLRAALANGCSWSKVRRMAQYYDYIEIQPDYDWTVIPHKGYQLKLIDGLTASRMSLSKLLLKLGKESNIPVVATGNVHFLRPEDTAARAALQHAQRYEHAERQPPLFLHTTAEMLAAFSCLDEQDALEVVVRAPNQIAGMIDPDIRPIPQGRMVLPRIESDKTLLQDTVWRQAKQMYGEPLPLALQSRLELELGGIVAAGHAVLFAAAQKLAEQSRQAGYPVISRGLAGGSTVAFFTGISEVNPLPAHYLCRNCRYSDFAVGSNVASGFDLPPKTCPRCGVPLYGDGHNIPFETFLGLDGQRLPDIDLNFSGEYQAQAYSHAREMFGEENVFYAGTVGSIRDKLAAQYVQSYIAAHGTHIQKEGVDSGTLSRSLVGVAKTTGRHPGGLVVLPKGDDIHNYTPVQYPADDTGKGGLSTHFEYRHLRNTLYKFDLLGHDTPTMLHQLGKLTGISSADVPMDDAKVYSLLASPAALGVKAGEIGCETGTLGIPELGTSFVRRMLAETQPKNFGDLIKISGLSHGTGVWLNNAEHLLQSGQCTLQEVVATREDTFLYLQKKGIERERAFAVMEEVRSGKAAKNGFSATAETLMRKHGVPNWYIESCRKIQYLFPKAHAVSYLIASVRLMWYKLYHPLAFYAALFTVRESPMEYEALLEGQETIRHCIRQLEKTECRTYKEDEALEALRLANECLCRGFGFLPAELGKSRAAAYEAEDSKLRLPYIAISGIGLHAARALEEKSHPKETYRSYEDLRQQIGGLSRLVIDALDETGLLHGIP